MKDLIFGTIMFALITIFFGLYSWDKVKKASNNNQYLSDDDRLHFGLATLGVSFGAVLTSLFLYATVKNITNQNYQIEPQTKKIIRVEKTGDTMSIYNDDDYKIVFDLEKGSEEVYHKNEKQNNVRIDGLQVLKENFDGIKNNELLLSTNYKITKDGVLKNIQISISENKNKDDFEIKY